MSSTANARCAPHPQLMDYDSPSHMKFVMKVDNRKGITSRCATAPLFIITYNRVLVLFPTCLCI